MNLQGLENTLITWRLQNILIEKYLTEFTISTLLRHQEFDIWYVIADISHLEPGCKMCDFSIKPRLSWFRETLNHDVDDILLSVSLMMEVTSEQTWLTPWQMMIHHENVPGLLHPLSVATINTLIEFIRIHTLLPTARSPATEQCLTMKTFTRVKFSSSMWSDFSLIIAVNVSGIDKTVNKCFVNKSNYYSNPPLLLPAWQLYNMVSLLQHLLSTSHYLQPNQSI